MLITLEAWRVNIVNRPFALVDHVINFQQGCHQGFPTATMSVVPRNFYWKTRKIEPKEIPSCLIPRLLVGFTRQLEIILVTIINPVSANMKTVRF